MKALASYVMAGSLLAVAGCASTPAADAAEPLTVTDDDIRIGLQVAHGGMPDRVDEGCFWDAARATVSNEAASVEGADNEEKTARLAIRAAKFGVMACSVATAPEEGAS